VFPPEPVASSTGGTVIGGGFLLAAHVRARNIRAAQRINMFSHVVIFWTNPDKPSAADDLIAGANKYLQPIPGLIHFHIGKMAGSHRPVVDQSYQVALNTVFPSKQAQDDYQVHPLHVEFIEKVFKPNCAKVVVYDFESSVYFQQPVESLATEAAG